MKKLLSAVNSTAEDMGEKYPRYTLVVNTVNSINDVIIVYNIIRQYDEDTIFISSFDDLELAVECFNSFVGKDC